MPNVYDTITQQIIKSIEEGAGAFSMPWHKPASGIPVNAVTNNHYNGGNVMALWCASMSKGYSSDTWATYKQWATLGAQVKKGEKATTGIYFSTFEKEDDSGNVKKLGFGKPFFLFNAAQVDNYAQESAPQVDLTKRIAFADSTILATGASIVHQGNRAFYQPSTDSIQLPERDQFTGTATSTPTESYYSTLLHELTHWTGSAKRLERVKGKRFGDQAYAFEELVAEIGAAFLCARLGITNDPRVDHAQYIASWLNVLKGDSRAIITASSEAQKACDYILQSKLEKISIAA